MGNQTSNCFFAESRRAKVLDLRRKNLLLVDVPVTAAELMLQEPGHVVWPLRDLRRDWRLSAMKADDRLSGGRVYLLFPVSRIRGRVTESEMEVIESVCGGSWRWKRRSLVGPQPTVTEDGQRQVKLSVEESRRDVALSCRMRQLYWKPVLEPIHETI